MDDPPAVVNREDPVPVISVSSHSVENSPSATGDKTGHDSVGSGISARRLKNKFKGMKSEAKALSDWATGSSLQELLLTKLWEQVIPVEDRGEEADFLTNKPSAINIGRPAFSLPAMSNNFRRFNARIGIVFSFQERVINVLSWQTSTHTLSFLSVYSFICLNPYLLIILPFAVFLLFIMVPGFLARHPPPPVSASTSSPTAYYSYEGPALAPAQTIKPASETSKDFFHNMRDLQNSMADFANLHDATVSLLSPATNFSNEILSSTLFLILTVLSAILFLTAHLIPWRTLFLIGGNAAILGSNPSVAAFMQQIRSQMKEAATEFQNTADDDFYIILGIPIPSSPSALLTLLKSAAAISLDTYAEEREVEIFELQHKSLSPYSAASEWESFVFTPTPYDPLSPSRIAGDRPRGTRFFEDVKPPPGWKWKGKKWQLDLECREWVIERMITGVGFEVPGYSSGDAVSEEVGGWVWDLPFHPPDEDAYNDDVLVYGDNRETKEKAKAEQEESKGKLAKGNFEESLAKIEGTGEWRRRRWVRVVQRASVDDSGSA
ncbi:peroxin 24 [Histoplasma capsulatum G186AR]|uniref:Peroxin 24 n=2 Tax=Ajellomyces capsulatus TaxID=5037 RepID=C0NLN2_AJECG|nr:peroxin 24 [Histoplasma capsulatum G186AR]EEH07533.1 peroxin 24 [Histoplasma capsulatum G186AR]KAG5304320.1 peroxin 24 [Histoplasma capsulatum]QSS69918.1 peroxin 24 [Histoplasma capsulatum G186AR]